MGSFLQEQWVADRAKLRCLLRDHPDWSLRQLSEATNRSTAWVKDWKKRLLAASPNDQTVLWGLSHAPHKPHQSPPQLLLDRLLEWRTNPPEGLKRVPGPRTLLYFLAKDPLLQAEGIKPPRSTSTIYQLLVSLGCIARPGLKKAQPQQRSAPLESIAVDFKDITTVEIDPDGKKQHCIEVFNFVDEGTSLLWAAVARDDFNAESVVETLLAVFGEQGLPRQLRFDRDPRFVGARQGRDFPSAMVRMLHVLGVQPAICPPHRPDKNAFVERYNRAYKTECVLVGHPENLSRVREVTAEYQQHYNFVRPHQGKSCHNLPPRVAFPELPALPGLPMLLDPDHWLVAVEGEHFTRKVKRDGSVLLDKYPYYLGQALAGEYVVLEVDAVKRELVVYHHQREIRRLRLKGLYRRAMSLEEYRQAIMEEARSERRGWRPQVESGSEEVAGGAAVGPVK
jgi:hypothetical protein